MTGPANSRRASRQGGQQFCTFWVGGRYFGVDILDIKEVNTETSFTPVFHAPPVVMGLVNIRGQIHLVLDMRRVLGFPPDDDIPDKRLLIFKPTVAQPFGVLVDTIGDILAPEPSCIERQGFADKVGEGEAGTLGKGMVLGICKLEDRLMVILNPRGFMNSVTT